MTYLHRCHLFLVDMLSMVVDLDADVLEVIELIKETFILNMAIEGEAMWALIRVHALGAIVNEVLDLMESINGCVSFAVSNDDYEIHLQTLVVALGEKEAVGEACCTHELLEAASLAVLGLLSHLEERVEAWHVGDCGGRFPAVADNVVRSFLHCWVRVGNKVTKLL